VESKQGVTRRRHEPLGLKAIRQTATIRGATPHDVYETIMDSKKHTKLAGSRTTVSRRVGGAFKVGRDLEGKNLALVKDKKIVQSWRANDWPRGQYSRATFSLARTTGGTRIRLFQSGVPDRHYQSISSGWHEYYWGPLREQFAPK
jgi:activator of HSP90 ATPase